jgi:hypothetical protein
MLTAKKILKLRPEFKFGDMTMFDWFEIHRGFGYCTIKSGLKHVEEDIKSPYYYMDFEGGKNAYKNCLKRFNTWWEEKSKEIKT